MWEGTICTVRSVLLNSDPDLVVTLVLNICFQKCWKGFSYYTLWRQLIPQTKDVRDNIFCPGSFSSIWFGKTQSRLDWKRTGGCPRVLVNVFQTKMWQFINILKFCPNPIILKRIKQISLKFSLCNIEMNAWPNKYEHLTKQIWIQVFESNFSTSVNKFAWHCFIKCLL